MSLPKPVPRRRITGQGITEYIILVFLIGIGTIALVTLLGDDIRTLFGANAESLAGEPNVANPAQPATNTKFNMKGGSTNPYDTGSCGFSSCPIP